MQNIKIQIRNYLMRRSFYQNLLDEKQILETELKKYQHLINYKWFVEPGHFYSPLIDGTEEDHRHLVDLWNLKQKVVALPGVDVRSAKMWELLKSIGKSNSEFSDYKTKKDIRFRFDNDQFGQTDANFLFLMLRFLKPKKIIEVGSGWSSALMLDLNQFYSKTPAQLTFIEPYTDRLNSAIKKSDKKNCDIIASGVQGVPIKDFKKLQSGDVLFIDNSHVSKTGSDVNYLFLQVLPQLNKGVYIHVHDIFYPFEYPIQWVVEDRRNWNEIYVLHALLIGSNMFEIVMWSSYLSAQDKKKFASAVPEAKDFGGSIWLRKVN